MAELKLQFPEDFYKEETRCDYLVTEEMKKIWAVELDLLCRLLEVCRKHNITIYASGGTLLGTIRHGGFIPWDDDIDMMMMRDDYEKLCRVAAEEFTEPYFFQTEYSDPGSLRGHAQLRNSSTTAILRKEGDYRFNQGIFLDIFPLDAVTEDEVLLEKQRRKAVRYFELSKKISRVSYRYYRNGNGIKETVKSIVNFLFNGIIRKSQLEQKLYRKFELECMRYNNTDTKMVSTLTFHFENKQHYKFREDFTRITQRPFEFINIPVPEDYDHALTQRFGDYMKIVKASNCHGEILFDTEKSYTEYFKNYGE